MRKLTAFPRSNNPISPYTFRFPLWSCQLEQACNLLWCFITFIFTPPHWLAINATSTFLCRHGIDPYIRGFRQSVVDNSHHRYFVDSRRVICIQYLYRTFVSRVATLLRQTSADFIELQTPAFTAGAGRSIREGISGRYPIILPFELSVVAYPLRNKPDVFSIAWP